jgi:NarL family two-component system response regulator LiaR
LSGVCKTLSESLFFSLCSPIFKGIKTIVSIVEDSKEYQQTLINLIADSRNYQVGEVFLSAEKALPYISKLSGIIIVDIKLPGMNGANLMGLISNVNKNVQCIICSLYDDDAFIFLALKNGAVGYLLKDSTGDQILTALDDVMHGGSPMSPYIARRVIESFQQTKSKSLSEVLSDREQEVLNQVAEGLIYKEVAEKLFISHETVKKHLKNIYQKLHVQNKMEAVNKLRRS